MNLDPHYLKVTHEGISSEELADLAYYAYLQGNENGSKVIRAELKRRRESDPHEHHKPML
jgi:hypothetical protein